MEIGPGNLYLAVDLLGYFKRGTLIDYNLQVKDRYDNLEEPLKERLDLVIAEFFTSVTQLQLKYDCVVACEVMEHVENDSNFLSIAYDLLDDQGQLVLSVPSRMKYWSKHDEIVGHFRRYEKQQLVNMISGQGFQNICVVSYGFPFLNILRLPRVLLAWFQYDRRVKWSKDRQIQQSGLIQANFLISLLGVICNKHTVYPLNLLSSPFNGRDLSDGYVITAEKTN